MFHATTMVAAFFICLGILNGPCQAYYELFHNPFDPARIITLLGLHHLWHPLLPNVLNALQAFLGWAGCP